MPAYDFRCKSCRHTFEVVRPSADTTAPPCPECGSETKRVFTPVGIQFKGSGFHSTDYREKPAFEGTCEAAGTPECTCCQEAAGE